MNPESPFAGDWAWFGFKGAPVPGVDYSWIHIQSSLNFAGYANNAFGCDLYFSSRCSHMLLIRTLSKSQTIWNIEECQFTQFLRSRALYCVRRHRRVFHLSNVSLSFVEFLVRVGRAAPECLDQMGCETMRQLITHSTRPAALPVDASQLQAVSGPIAVVVTGTDIEEEIQGMLSSVEEALVVVRSTQSWKLSLAEMTAIHTAHVGRFFLVIDTQDGNRYEIAFDDIDIPEANRVKRIITAALDCR
jgi:hypothetical protein